MVQQNIKTGVSKQVSFTFKGHPQADEVKVEFNPMWDCSYSINQPFHGMLTELLESKYGNIDSTAPNKIAINVTKFEQNIDKDSWSTPRSVSIYLAVELQVDKNGKNETKRFAYDIGVPIESGFDNANKFFHNKLTESVKELLVKFTISIDKYLDSFEM